MKVTRPTETQPLHRWRYSLLSSSPSRLPSLRSFFSLFSSAPCVSYFLRVPEAVRRSKKNKQKRQAMISPLRPLNWLVLNLVLMAGCIIRKILWYLFCLMRFTSCWQVEKERIRKHTENKWKLTNKGLASWCVHLAHYTPWDLLLSAQGLVGGILPPAALSRLCQVRSLPQPRRSSPFHPRRRMPAD